MDTRIMKKLILIFIALLIAIPCFARSVQDAHKSVIARMNVASCTRTTGTYLSEGFEDAGYEAMTGAETVGASCSLDEDSTTNLYICGGAQNLESVSAADGYEAIKYHDIGAEQATTYGRFYFYVVTSIGSTTKNIFACYDTSWVNAFNIGIVDNGSLKAYVSGTEITYDELIISYDTWYYVEWKHDITGNSFEWWVDGVSQGTDSTINASVTGIEHVYIGWKKAADQNTGTIYFDLLDIHSSQLGAVK